MITLHETNGNKHTLKPGDRLVINTQDRTIGFLNNGGQPLRFIRGGDDKTLLMGMSPNSVAGLISEIAGLDLKETPGYKNGTVCYIFTERR